ncbi:MAG TPA: hypothetical protein DCP96_05815 [Lachnospiraceae bacterium]|jgi:fermentation-respiration switch protein FrsA (DUF1100 family)|nr:hypothetical protein [Lachnospiraceae bacterium]HBE08668.1 hypothetical protein [Lachnospiraceae bacterium]
MGPIVVALILIFLLAMALAFIIPVSYILAKYVSEPHTISYQDAYDTEKEKGFLEGYDSLEKEEIMIPSFDGYELHGEVILREGLKESEGKEESDGRNGSDGSDESHGAGSKERFVILTHGYTYNRLGSVKYMNLYRKMGYSCIQYDLRGHGANAKCPVTMGLKESKDLLAVIDWVHERYGENIILGLHGESMGSASQTLALREKPRVDFVVNDCGFAELTEVLRGQLSKRFHLPAFLVSTASILNKIYYKYSYQEVRPVDALKENQVPICFMHGREDTFIPYQHSELMAETTKGYQEVHLYEDADHALSFEKHPKEYEENLKAFLEKVLG